jgi:hypothetical protein
MDLPNFAFGLTRRLEGVPKTTILYVGYQLVCIDGDDATDVPSGSKVTLGANFNSRGVAF